MVARDETFSTAKDRDIGNEVRVSLVQGKEAIPEAVDHVVVEIDPQTDRSWLQQTPQVYTDNAHTFDNTGPQLQTEENWSEGLKRLKPRMLQRIIDTFK